MLTAVLLCAMAQVYSVSLDPVPACPTCSALTARVAALESQLAARTAVADPPRRVRLIQVSEPAPVVTYTAPTVIRYPQFITDWAPGSYSYAGVTYPVQRPGLFGGRFGGRFASVSACGPGGCP